MKQITKLFVSEYNHISIIPVPIDGKIVSCGWFQDKPTMWCIGDGSLGKVHRKFALRNDGDEIKANEHYIGTCNDPKSRPVHIFEII